MTQESSRCKHGVAGTDCFECFPTIVCALKDEPYHVFYQTATSGGIMTGPDAFYSAQHNNDESPEIAARYANVGYKAGQKAQEEKDTVTMNALINEINILKDWIIENAELCFACDEIAEFIDGQPGYSTVACKKHKTKDMSEWEYSPLNIFKPKKDN